MRRAMYGGESQMPDYEAIIGMEVHAQLQTRSKMFCGCNADVFGARPNTHTCPVCLGMPGALPVINRRAVEQTILVGLALGCRIAETAIFSRKNYVYPDLPKSYQISMYDFPLCEHGWLELDDPEGPEGAVKRIRVRRVHLEEDTGKSLHVGNHSLLDFNRSGLPLLEIVTEPDISSPEEARQFLVKLRTILRYLGVSTGDMEKGAMRGEANVSLRRSGADELGTKVEVKNLNSFRAVKLALDYEIARQAEALDLGEQVRQVTMGWDDRRGSTVEQRSKEESDDYRYFPEPDLPPLRISRDWVARIAATLPQLPDDRRDRFISRYGLSRADASTLASDRDVADYYESAVTTGRQEGISPRTIANWVTGELFRLLNAQDVEIQCTKVTPSALADLIGFVEKGIITSDSGRRVLAEMFGTGRPADQIIEEKQLTQISDHNTLVKVVEDVLASHPSEVAQYRAGKETLLQWFVGQVMRATRGKANPQMVRELLKGWLDG